MGNADVRVGSLPVIVAETGPCADALRPAAAARPSRLTCSLYDSARVRTRVIILSRSRRNAALLSLSRSAGIDENAASIAMSFASAKLVFINCNSFSIRSNVRLDKPFSWSGSGGDYSRSPLGRQGRSQHSNVIRKIRLAVSVGHGPAGVILGTVASPGRPISCGDSRMPAPDRRLIFDSFIRNNNLAGNNCAYRSVYVRMSLRPATPIIAVSWLPNT